MTAQAPDWLIYRNERHRLFSNPLEQYLRSVPNRPPFRAWSTANWRGYIATWEFRDEVLYLTDLRVAPENETNPGIAFVFPDAKGPVKADWVSQRLRVPLGDELRYVHMGYESQYARELYLSVWNGRLCAVEEYERATNRTTVRELTPCIEELYGVEEAAFLRSICATPDDLAPRLIYADWLDERGDPRGAVVRTEEALRVSGSERLDPLFESDTFQSTIHAGIWTRIMGYRALEVPPDERRRTDTQGV